MNHPPKRHHIIPLIILHIHHPYKLRHLVDERPFSVKLWKRNHTVTQNYQTLNLSKVGEETSEAIPGKTAKKNSQKTTTTTFRVSIYYLCLYEDLSWARLRPTCFFVVVVLTSIINCGLLFLFLHLCL